MNSDKHLELLAQKYPNIRSAAGKILHLEMTLSLPKGTEYFFSDLHGEAGAFIHLLRSASGTVRQKIGVLFENILPEEEQNQLANLVYDPALILELLEKEGRLTESWKRLTSYRLVELLRFTASKYTRERIRQKTPSAFKDIIDEILFGPSQSEDLMLHTNAALDAVGKFGRFNMFIQELCFMIQAICVDQLHILGDIFDRGPGPHHIIDALIAHSNVDIQLGNHDVGWMGAASGSPVCIANVVRIGIGYSNFDMLEDGYAINMRPLYSFAMATYGDDACERFKVKVLDQNKYDSVDTELAAKMHKAISIIQFKLEGQLLKRHPEYDMSDRIVLEKVDWKRLVYQDCGKEYPLLDSHFPTIDPADPLKLTAGEEEVLHSLLASFRHGEHLRRHIHYLFQHSSIYRIQNNNLLFHGCIPMNADGSFTETHFLGQPYAGKNLMDALGQAVRDAWFSPYNSPQQRNARDLLYYLWCGKHSPLFGKSKIATFENFFVGDKNVCKEVMNPYYKLIEQPETCDRIFAEFGLDPQKAHIINGHVPVKIKNGESPRKANGKYYVIDGGIAKAYHAKTGIAGYTMIFNSHELSLVEHTNFEAIENDKGSYMPKMQSVEKMPRRLTIGDTTEGEAIRAQIEDLNALIQAYEAGEIINEEPVANVYDERNR